MILEQQAPDLLAGHEPVFALLFDMNVLWERFVAWLLRRACSALPGLEVTTQVSHALFHTPGKPARTVRPDIVLRRPGTKVPVLVADSKWKVPDRGTPSDDDLKQMFVRVQRAARRARRGARVSAGRRGSGAH